MIKYGLTICLIAGACQVDAMHHLLKPRLIRNVNAVMPKLLAMSSTPYASIRAYSVKNDDTNKEQELPFSSNPAHIYVAGYYSRMFGDDERHGKKDTNPTTGDAKKTSVVEPSKRTIAQELAFLDDKAKQGNKVLRELNAWSVITKERNNATSELDAVATKLHDCLKRLTCDDGGIAVNKIIENLKDQNNAHEGSRVLAGLRSLGSAIEFHDIAHLRAIIENLKDQNNAHEGSRVLAGLRSLGSAIEFHDIAHLRAIRELCITHSSLHAKYDNLGEKTYEEEKRLKYDLEDLNNEKCVTLAINLTIYEVSEKSLFLSKIEELLASHVEELEVAENELMEVLSERHSDFVSKFKGDRAKEPQLASAALPGQKHEIYVTMDILNKLKNRERKSWFLHQIEKLIDRRIKELRLP